MRKYEDFIREVQKRNIDELDLACPKCGGDLDFGDAWIDEWYAEDGTFHRQEELICCGCDFEAVIRQTYVPQRLEIEIEEEE